MGSMRSVRSMGRAALYASHTSHFEGADRPVELRVHHTPCALAGGVRSPAPAEALRDGAAVTEVGVPAGALLMGVSLRLGRRPSMGFTTAR